MIPETSESQPNKEKILQAAIRLFAEKGYANVSMREIAAQVNIKAASIYNHYSGKEALLDAIIGRFREGLHSRVYPRIKDVGSLEIQNFLNILIEANGIFFSDPMFARISQIILREQFTNASIRRTLLEELIVGPRNMIAAYFIRLMEAGKMVRVDPRLAAKEFHAFFIYRFYEISLSLDGPPPELDPNEEAEHIRLFLKNYIVEHNI